MRRLTVLRSSTPGWKSAAGVSSSAMPVKWRETSASGSRRTPRAGSWIDRAAAPRPPAARRSGSGPSAGCTAARSCGSSLQLGAHRPRRQMQLRRRPASGRPASRPSATPRSAPQRGEVDAMAVGARRPSPGTRARTRRPRSAGPSAGARRGASRSCSASSIDAARLPHTRPARLSTGSKIHSIRRRRSSRTSASSCMPGRQRLVVAVGATSSAGRGDRDAVQRLAEAAAPASGRLASSAAAAACATPATTGRLVAELLIRKGLVAQQHRLVGPDEADRARRREQMRLQARVGRHRLAMRRRRRPRFARPRRSTAETIAVLRRAHHDPVPGLVLGRLLRQLRQARVRSRSGPRGRAAALARARPCSAAISRRCAARWRSSAISCALTPNSSSDLVRTWASET